MNWKLDLGANISSDGSVAFKIWAPLQTSLKIQVNRPDFKSPIPMEKDKKNYFHLNLDGIKAQDTYSYLVGETLFPDPVSRYLPNGPFGPTAIIDPNQFSWTDQNWKGVDQEELIFYECHVGTFSSEGTFEAISKKLPYLKELGITCLELMPSAQFSGKFGWGYDGSSLYATHNAYGTPDSLKQLVNECHEHGISVCLDVVYNHFGIEGVCIGNFGYYWSDKYHTLWGKAVNYDGPYNEGVRHYIMQNALYWIHEYHIDALRFDALHAVYDFSSKPFFKDLCTTLEKTRKELDKNIHLITESDLNDSRLIRSRQKGGFGFSAWWNEDFHHSIHSTLTDEKDGYYLDFHGIKDLKKVLSHQVVYNGKYSEYRKLEHGNSFRGIKPKQLVSFVQNHDQIGNRPNGERISRLIGFEKQKISAFFLILSPYLPLLFMGEEYGEDAPFEYFVDLQNKELLENIYEERKKGFESVNIEVSDPDEFAFKRSKLRWDFLEKNQKNVLLTIYRTLIHFRRTSAIFKHLNRKQIKVYSFTPENWIALEYIPIKKDKNGLALFFYMGDKKKEFTLPFSTKNLKLLLDTDREEYGGNNALLFDEHNVKITLMGPSAVLFQTNFSL